MGKTPQELYQEREKRVADAIRLTIPDSVPISTILGYFPAKYAGITCEAAFAIAEKLSVAPMTVGTAIDLQEGRIVGCQLGLFGYGKRKKLLDHPQDIDEAVQRTIQAALTKDRLSCEIAWQIADAQSVPRLEIARLCESMGVRICQCQLGAF